MEQSSTNWAIAVLWIASVCGYRIDFYWKCLKANSRFLNKNINHFAQGLCSVSLVVLIVSGFDSRWHTNMNTVHSTISAPKVLLLVSCMIWCSRLVLWTGNRDRNNPSKSLWMFSIYGLKVWASSSHLVVSERTTKCWLRHLHWPRCSYWQFQILATVHHSRLVGTEWLNFLSLEHLSESNVWYHYRTLKVGSVCLWTNHAITSCLLWIVDMFKSEVAWRPLEGIVSTRETSFLIFLWVYNTSNGLPTSFSKVGRCSG